MIRLFILNLKPTNSKAMRALVLLFISCMLFSCTKEGTKAVASKTDAERVIDSAIAATNTEQKAETAGWSYRDQEDKMGSPMKFASLDSKDILEFGFPYDGGSTSRLTLRKTPSGTDIMYFISKGQIVSVNPVNGGNVRVRFDDEKPMTVSAEGSSDYSNDVIFLGSTNKIIQKLKNSKRMVIEVEFYNEGKRQVEFDVSGLTWD